MKEKKTSIIPRSKKTNKEFLMNHIEYLNLPNWGKKKIRKKQKPINTQIIEHSCNNQPPPPPQWVGFPILSSNLGDKGDFLTSPYSAKTADIFILLDDCMWIIAIVSWSCNLREKITKWHWDRNRWK